MSRSYGLKFDEVKPQDYKFGGGFVPMDILQPDGDWEDYLPLKEIQNLNDIEPSACVAFTVLNCIEILIKRQYNEDANYSDRFLAAISGTKEGGNSPQTVCEFLRKIGVVPQELWPFDETITSFDSFYSPVPPKLYELAQEFNKKYTFKHEYVDPEKITQALKSSPLLISVPAWFLGDNGRYYRPEGIPDNHATTLIGENINYRLIFDSYGDPFIKEVELSVIPKVIKRFYIKKKTQEGGNMIKYIYGKIKDTFSC